MPDQTNKISKAFNLLFILFLGGCATEQKNIWYQDLFTDREGVRPEYKATASRINYTHRVEFANGDARLSVEERDRLDVFLTKTGVEKKDRFLVVGGGEESRLSERRRSTVRAFLELRNVPTNIPSGLMTIEDTSDTVRVVVSRFVVTLPSCPDMSDDPTDGRNNQPYSNFGCATATNLGLMVARPEDLVQGRRMGGADGDYMAISIQNYRAGKTKPLLGESGATENVPTGDLLKAATGGE